MHCSTAYNTAERYIMHVQEVGLAGMLSLLTAVLLHTTATGSTEPDYTALPHNYCAVAQLVLRSALCWAASIYCVCSCVSNTWTHQQSDPQQQ